jgi:hypothetical protein
MPGQGLSSRARAWNGQKELSHSDPRWLPLLRKIGKAPDQLAKIEFKLPQW